MDPEDPMVLVARRLTESAELKRRTIAVCGPAIVRASELLVGCFQRRGRVLLCGNGGSAADCQHLAAEFVGGLNREAPRPALGAIALTSDTSILTARSNDVGFEDVFARQVEALGQTGDVLIGLSTSGNSANVLHALETARARSLTTIVFTGDGGGKALPLADLCIAIPSRVTQHIQEAHLAAGHVLCELVERRLFPREVRT
jgi:D-sedoheptulose 7-phosphate isomerase